MSAHNRLYDFTLSVLLIFTIYIIGNLLRGLDDNTLVRWAWLFNKRLSLFYFFLTFLSLILAYVASYTLPLRIYYLLPVPLILLFPVYNLPEVIIDSSRYFIQAKYLEVNGIVYFFKNWGTSITAWTDTPLIPFLYGLIFKLIGEFRVAVFIFNTILFIFSVFLTYKIGTILFNEKTGLYSSALLCSIPYLLLLTPQLLVDVNTMFFFVLSVYMLLMSAYRGGIFRAIIAGLSITFALLSKFSIWAISFIYPIILFVVYLKRGKSFRSSSLNALFLGTLIISIFVFLKWDILIKQFNLLLGFQKTGLQTWSEGYISIFFFHMYPLMIPFCLLGLYMAIKEKEASIFIPLCFFLFLILFSAKRMRYLIPFFPLFVLMAGYGLSKIHNEHKQRYLVFAAIFWSFIVLSFIYSPFLNRTNMKNIQLAAIEINREPLSKVNVIALPQTYSLANSSIAMALLDYYSDKDLIFIGNWKNTKNDKLPEYHPLRFSWEINLPDYYKGYIEPDNPLVVIHDKTGGPATVDCAPYKEFVSNTGLFRYKIHLSLYKKTCLNISSL